MTDPTDALSAASIANVFKYQNQYNLHMV